MTNDPKTLAGEIMSGSVRALAKGITLLESKNPDDRAKSLELLKGIYKSTGNSIRIGVSGSPGVGKSTFIETWGKGLLKDGKKLAILTIDPSSPRSHGSILGDKTRMQTLSVSQNCFIRPSPAGDTLGGVTRRTRESILLCEAAGYDTVIIETVGVGQSEHILSKMVDLFVVLTLPNAGDQLQGIKKGILELADFIIVTKADGPYTNSARKAVLDHLSAVHFLNLGPDMEPPKVLSCSSTENLGFTEINFAVNELTARRRKTDLINKKRSLQEGFWYRSEITEQLTERILQSREINDLIRDISKNFVLNHNAPPSVAAHYAVDQIAKRLHI